MWEQLAKDDYIINFNDPSSITYMVDLGLITADQYKEITGVDYVANSQG